jgi:bacterioferritin
MKAIPVKNERSPFLADIRAPPTGSGSRMEQGAVTNGYKADRETVIKILNDVVATEIVCVLRYKRHYYTASGIHFKSVAQEF